MTESKKLFEIDHEVNRRWQDLWNIDIAAMYMAVEGFVRERHLTDPSWYSEIGVGDCSYLRMVGGCVRDLILGVTPKDIDFCTPLTPEAMALAFYPLRATLKVEIIETGLKHGTITLRFPQSGNQYEITSLRKDVDTDGRHAEVEFVTDYRTDAERRDFTMNAMSIDQFGTIYDYFGGIADAQNRIVRFVGDPRKRIQEDYLRILRFYRFAARMGKLVLDSATAHALSYCIPDLARISGERIWAELSKILLTPDSSFVLYGMSENSEFFEAALGLQTTRTGKLKDLYTTKFEVDDAVHYDVLDLRRDQNVPVAGLLFAWLMAGSEISHDFGLVRYMADTLVKRLKLSREEASLLRALCDHWADHDGENLYEAVMVQRVTLEHARVIAAVSFMEPPEFDPNWVPPEFPVRGQDLLDRGVPRGKLMGVALKGMRESWAKSHGTKTKDQLIAEVLK